MKKLNLKNYSIILYVTLAILTAMALRQIGIRVEAPLDQIIDSL